MAVIGAVAGVINFVFVHSLFELVWFGSIGFDMIEVNDDGADAHMYDKEINQT